MSMTQIMSNLAAQAAALRAKKQIQDLQELADQLEQEAQRIEQAIDALNRIFQNPEYIDE